MRGEENLENTKRLEYLTDEWIVNAGNSMPVWASAASATNRKPAKRHNAHWQCLGRWLFGRLAGRPRWLHLAVRQLPDGLCSLHTPRHPQRLRNRNAQRVRVSSRAEERRTGDGDAIPCGDDFRIDHRPEGFTDIARVGEIPGGCDEERADPTNEGEIPGWRLSGAVGSKTKA